jgi:antitoxin PrlF
MVRKARSSNFVTLTSKGQMTLPKSVRDSLGLKAGDRLEVAVDRQHIVLIPRSLHLGDVCSLLPAPAKPVSLAEMDEAIARGASE